MAHFTTLIGNRARRLELPSPQLVSQWKIPFSQPVMVQCAELGDISGPLYSGGGECRHAYCLPFRSHHFSRIDSTPHSLHGWQSALASAGGYAEGRGGMCGQLHQVKWEQRRQPRWMIACCVRRLFWDAVCGWMLSSSGRCSCRSITKEDTRLTQLQSTVCSDSSKNHPTSLCLIRGWARK